MCEYSLLYFAIFCCPGCSPARIDSSSPHDPQRINGKWSVFRSWFSSWPLKVCYTPVLPFTNSHAYSVGSNCQTSGLWTTPCWATAAQRSEVQRQMDGWYTLRNMVWFTSIYLCNHHFGTPFSLILYFVLFQLSYKLFSHIVCTSFTHETL